MRPSTALTATMLLMLASLRSRAQPAPAVEPVLPDQQSHDVEPDPAPAAEAPQPDPQVPDTDAPQRRPQPPPVQVVERPVTPPSRPCGQAFYLEPSLMIALGEHSSTPFPDHPSNAGRLMHRLALGVIVRLCDRDGAPSTHVRGGPTVYLTNLDWGGRSMDYVGVGGEVEVNHPVTSTLRLGGRIGVETAGASGGTGSLWTFGARLHVRDAIWLGLDVWHRRPGASEMPRCGDTDDSAGCAASMSGAMVGFGLEGRPGALTSGIGLGVVGALLLVLVVAVAAQDPGH